MDQPVGSWTSHRSTRMSWSRSAQLLHKASCTVGYNDYYTSIITNVKGHLVRLETIIEQRCFPSHTMRRCWGAHFFQCVVVTGFCHFNVVGRSTCIFPITRFSASFGIASRWWVLRSTGGNSYALYRWCGRSVVVPNDILLYKSFVYTKRRWGVKVMRSGIMLYIIVDSRDRTNHLPKYVQKLGHGACSLCFHAIMYSSSLTFVSIFRNWRTFSVAPPMTKTVINTIIMVVDINSRSWRKVSGKERTQA